MWLKAQNFFQNSVEQVVFTNELLKDGQTFVNNINALAHHSMLNDETKANYAIAKKMQKILLLKLRTTE